MTAKSSTRVPFYQRNSVWIFGLATFFSAYVANEYLALRGHIPPSQNCTLTEFAEKMPPPTRLIFLNHHNIPRIYWVGDIALLTCPSGPPCYVFDEHCRLVEWTHDIGEGSPLQDDVLQAKPADIISIEDAFRRCQLPGESVAERTANERQ